MSSSHLKQLEQFRIVGIEVLNMNLLLSLKSVFLPRVPKDHMLSSLYRICSRKYKLKKCIVENSRESVTLKLRDLKCNIEIESVTLKLRDHEALRRCSNPKLIGNVRRGK